MKTKRRALVLQGGGALGAYAYGAVKALYEQPGFRLDVVTGVSIGAINAAVLVGAKDDSMRALDRLWRDHLCIRPGPFASPLFARYRSLLANPALYWLRPSYVFTPLLAPFVETSIYDTAPLRSTLAELIDLTRLNQSPIHLAVSAVDIETGEVRYFENRGQEPLSFEHIVASGSLAPGFPMTAIRDEQTGEEHWYWDGGFASNLPMERAIDLLEQADADNPDVERELIVIELFPKRSKVPENLIEVEDRVTQLLFSSKLILDERLFERMNDYVDLIQQIDQVLPPDSPLRRSPGYQDLIRHKKIDSFLVITSPNLEGRSGASDFSQAAIEGRIAAGYQDTRTQLEAFGRRSSQDQNAPLDVTRLVKPRGMH
jgi:NTE family protein